MAKPGALYLWMVLFTVTLGGAGGCGGTPPDSAGDAGVDGIDDINGADAAIDAAIDDDTGHESPPENGSPDDELADASSEDDPAGCAEGNIRNIACGLNDTGVQPQACNDGEWIDDGPCIDPHDCVEAEERTVACRIEGPRTLQPQVCVEGRWQPDGDCICEDEGHVYDALADACLAPIPCDDTQSSPFGGGDGSEEAPYLICNLTHLQNVSDFLGAHYVLARNLIRVQILNS